MSRFVVKRLRLPANIVSFHREEGWYDPSLPGKNKVVSRRWGLETRDWPWASDQQIRCPFCGRESILFRNVPRSPARLGCWNCDAVFHLLPRKAVRTRARRLPKPVRKVPLFCWACGWEGEWGRGECVRHIREEYGALLCPECYCDLGIEYKEGVPRYVKNASKR
jgi:hypothetical protein